MENRNDKILDSLIETAADDAAFQEMNDMPSCEDLDKIYIPSPEMDKKVRRIISKIENEKRVKRFLKLSGKIAAGFLLFFALSATILMSVKASRTYIFNMFLKWNSGNVLINFKTADFDNIVAKYSFNYIPKGFSLTKIESDDRIKTYLYTNESNQQLIIQLSPADTGSFFLE